ncbi:MAG: MauE/DoxX family redox-associated membrane protein [Agriterribacter sp.]
MKKSMVTEWIPALLILLFAYTAISKLADYRRFTMVLEQFPFLRSTSHIVAWLLPLSELMIVALLFFPATRLAGLASSLIAMTAFTVFLVYIITFYPKLPCNCGGVLEWLSWKQHVAFNSVFLLINFGAIIIYPKVSKG